MPKDILRSVYETNLGNNPGILVDSTTNALNIMDQFQGLMGRGKLFQLTSYQGQLAANASATLMLSGNTTDCHAIITIANTSSECCAQLSEFTGATASGTTIGPGVNLKRSSSNVSLLSGQVNVTPTSATGETLLQTIAIPMNYFASFGANNGRYEWVLAANKKYLIKVGNTGPAPADVCINVTYFEE